jgi:hypothetical protein
MFVDYSFVVLTLFNITEYNISNTQFVSTGGVLPGVCNQNQIRRTSRTCMTINKMVMVPYLVRNLIEFSLDAFLTKPEINV